MDSRKSGQPGPRLSYSSIFYCTIISITLSSCSLASELPSRNVDINGGQLNKPIDPTSLKTDLTHGRPIPNSETERLARQLSFFEWLFGPPAKSNSTYPHENPTVSHNNQNHTSHLTKTAHLSVHPHKEPEILAFENPLNSSLVYYPSINGSDADSTFPSGPIYAKPRNASNRFNNSRQIQITDIQASVGTELDESNLNSDPAQVNLQEELDAIDRLEKNLTDGSGRRKKRQSQSQNKNKFRQINIPYASENNRINSFSKRQLFMTPEQQMLALRQQQEIAAATMLQHQLLSVNNNRYNNRYIDDYYDDDSSYEDSDEPYENFNRFGLHIPVAAAMNRGAIFGGLGHPMGLGRRSIPEGESDTNNEKHIKRSRTRKASGRDSMGAISKRGRWETIEDYDLSSDFNRLQARKGKPEESSVFLGDSHKELDESDEEEMKTSFRNRGRTGMGRQDVTTETPADVPAPTEESSPSTPETENPSTSESPDHSVTETAGESSSSMSSTTEEGTTENVSDSSSTVESTTEAEASSTTEASTSETDVAATTESPSSSSPKPSTTKRPKPSTSTGKPSKLPPFQQTLNCRCGIQSVRGEMAEDRTIIRTMVNPWLVSVSTGQNKHLCSGSIINNKYVLTSKQCVEGIKSLIVTAGMGSRAAKNFTVIKVNSHESRNLALLRVKPPITPNHAMRPICLPIKKRDTTGATPVTGTLVTFKKSSSRINSPIELVQTEVPILSGAKCAGSKGDIPTGTICPGPPASLKCGGDTGGLLQVYQRGYSYQQIGVVANTVGCRASKTPGIYTDIRKSVKWIMYNTKDARYCRKPKVSPEDLMNTKRSGADNEPEFLEEESEEEFTFDEEALELEQEDDEVADESWE